MRFLLVFLCACQGFIDARAAESTLKILDAANAVAREQADVELARAAMPGGIFQLAAFARAYPDEPKFRVMYAESVCQYAVGFGFDAFEEAQLAGKETEELARHLEVSLDGCAEANLALRPAWRGKALDAIIATRGEVDQLRWLATASAMRIALAPMKHLADLPAVLAALKKCVELAPLAHEADAELLLGTLEAEAGRLLGGDGHARFEAARHEGALLPDVMFARAVAVRRSDRALFETTLQRVIATDTAKWPERRLANEMAKQKARRYLAAEDQLFH